MIGPILVVVGGVVAGALAGGLAGAGAAGVTGLALVGAVAMAAASWARRIGVLLEPEDAWEMAPRPPLFGGFVDRIYRRTLEMGPPQE